ncbi:MAG: DUF4397 domain-containing protein [Bacteroidia bacterium]|nr:DUF4397 domain-containing protein [Bacteroidia bacterium]
MKSRTIILGLSLISNFGWAQNAYLQLIHAVADVVGVSTPFILDSVDIYLSTDGGTNWTLAVPDFKFRDATPYIPIPANSSNVLAGIAPGNSTDHSDMLPLPPYQVPPLPANSYNIGIIAGTINFLLLQTNVNIYYYTSARAVATSTTSLDLIFFHAAPEINQVGTYLVFSRPPTASAYTPDTIFGRYEYTDYISISGPDFVVLDTNPSNRNDIFPLGFDIPVPGSLLGQSGVAFASGYIGDPNPKKRFGIHVALANGNVIALDTMRVRRLQIVHNAADTSLAQVDIHLGGVGSGAVIPLDFREATPTIFLPAPDNFPLPVAITRRGQNTPLANFTLNIPESGKNHIIFAQGVLVPTNYASNPNSISTSFKAHIIQNIKGWASSGQFIFIPFHGCTDAPSVDLYANNTPLATNIKYLESAPEVTLPAGTSANVQVRPAGQTTVVATFSLSSAQSQSGVGSVIFASGFLNPSANRNGPAFGLFIVYPDGTVEPLSSTTALSSYASTSEQLNVELTPSTDGNWTLYLTSSAQGEVPYALATISGQIISHGSYTLPAAGTWAYHIDGAQLQRGVYILRIGEKSVRLVRL